MGGILPPFQNSDGPHFNQLAAGPLLVSRLVNSTPQRNPEPMRKVAAMFVLAVFVPSLVLAWLAVRSLRDQQFVLERQRSLLYQGVTDAVARQVTSLLDLRLHEFGAQVEAMLETNAAEEVARSFDERLRTNWPSARVGFALGVNGEILSPLRSGRPEARAFRAENDEFLGNLESAEVYLNSFQNLNNSTTANWPAADRQVQREVEITALSQSAQTASNYSSIRFNRGVQTRKISPQQLSEAGNAGNFISVTDPNQQQLSKAVIAEAEFKQLIGELNEGTLARFVNNKLSVLAWYRSPRDGRFVFGAQLDLARIKDELRDQIPAAEPALREEICVAVLDDNAKPAALSHPDFKANWRRPFVATEIGEALPRWEVGAYLLNPTSLSRSARTLKLTLGLLIALLLAAIAVGSWLIVSDLNRQLKLARQKTDFVSNVSHELKTPLTSIRMFSDLLAEGRVRDSAKQHSYLNIISAETARLTRLINNVLDFSRMERGEKKYDIRDCDLGAVVRDTIDSYRPHLENCGFALACEIEPSGFPVRGDCDALAQVIVNLLSNAEKYSNGCKEIRVQVVRSPGSPAWAEVRILDRGIGVPRESSDRIFDKFYRAHDSLSSGVQGSGLGLTLARQIARAHGGDVTYRPRDDGGSCFVLRLPLHNKPSA